jgi:hypothetical protein
MTTNLSRIIVLSCCPVFWGNYSRFDVVFDKRTMTDSINTYTSFYPEIDLNGKIFNEVYVDTHNGSYDKSMYYFNLEFGLIGFTDIERQNLYVLDRIE